MANTNAEVSASVTLDTANTADTVTFNNYPTALRIRNTHATEHAYVRIGAAAVYGGDGATYVEASGPPVYLRCPKQRQVVLSFIGDANGEPTLVVDRVSAVPDVFSQNAPDSAEIDHELTDDAEDAQPSLIVNAVTAHELDDTSLATLEASTESALNALGTVINALETAVITALNAMGSKVNALSAEVKGALDEMGASVNEVIETLRTTGTFD